MAAFLFRLGKKWGVVTDSWQPATEQKEAFSDVDAEALDNQHREVWWLADKKISTGFPDGTFRG